MSIKDLFNTCLELNPTEREAALDRVASEAPDVAAEVRRLLDAHDACGDAFEPEVTPFEVPRGDAPPLDTGRRIGPYTIIETLGEGGMGVVYRARQDQPRREVALKVLPRAWARSSSLLRFEVEADALARVKHPCVAEIHDAGVLKDDDGDVPFIAMELVDGVDLRAWIARDRPSLRDRLALVVHVCDGIQTAHTQGVIHRDLKPSNVLVTSDRRPRIVDFGVARVIDREGTLTRAGEIVGTLAYMSPEQAQGGVHDVDTRSDQYALGVITYELLCGRRPIDVDGCSLSEAVHAVAHDVPQPPSAHATGVDVDLDTVVGKALAKDKRDRYPSVEAFAADLGRYLAGEPVQARPLSGLQSLLRAGRRHRVAFAVAAAFVVTLVASVVLLLSANRELEDARETAQKNLVDARSALATAEERKTTLERMVGERDAALRSAERDRESADKVRADAEHDQRRALAFSTAIEQLLGAGPFAAQTLHPDTRVLDLARELADVSRRSGQDPLLSGTLSYLAGHLHQQFGLNEKAAVLLEQAVEDLGRDVRTDQDRHSVLRAEIATAQVRSGRGDFAAASSLLNRAMSRIDEIEDASKRRPWKIGVWSLLSKLHAGMQRMEDSLRYTLDTARLIEEAPDLDAEELMGPAAITAQMLAHHERHDASEALFERIFEVLDADRSRVNERADVLSGRAYAERARKRPTAALRYAEEAVELARRHQPRSPGHQRALFQFVVACEEAKKPKPGIAAADEAVAFLEEQENRYAHATFLRQRARLRVQLDDFDGALADAQSALALLRGLTGAVDIRTRLTRFVCARLLLEHRWKEALDATLEYRRALRLAGDERSWNWLRTYAWSSEARFKMGERPAALADLRTAEKLVISLPKSKRRTQEHERILALIKQVEAAIEKTPGR